jgi:carbamoyl-phosphate synthase large subunit
MNYTIAISGINAIDNPGPGTGIARSLKESGLSIRTIGFAYDSMEPGIYMDWVIDKSYILPYPSGDVESFVNRLLNIHEKEKINVLISALDAELPVYMKIAPELEKQGPVDRISTSYRVEASEDYLYFPCFGD